MFTKGNHVTYSEVKELLSDGGYTKYFYTNHNTPGALDEMSVGMGKEPYTNYSTSYRVSSKEIERGLLISKELYKSTNNLVQKSVYEYINDKSPSTAFSKEISVRIVQTTSALWPCGGTVGGCTVMAGCVWATKLYAYNKLLKKVTETTYETSGPMETYTEYTYDQYRNKITTTTKNSFGKLLVDYIRYNSQVDYQGTATAVSAIAAKKLFTDYKINNYPIEQLTMLKPNMPIVGETCSSTILMANSLQFIN
jgi:hypothetical protein